MKYANIITLKELLSLTSFSDYIVVEDDSHKTLFNKFYYNNFYQGTEEYRVNYISSTPELIPTKENAIYEDTTEAKPEIYKKPNLLTDKDYCIKTLVVIYVSKITNEVLNNE